MQPKEFFGWLCKSQQDATFCLFLIRNLFFLWDKNLSHSQSLIKKTYFLSRKVSFSDVECPFNVAESAFNVAECRFNVAERNFHLGINTFISRFENYYDEEQSSLLLPVLCHHSKVHRCLWWKADLLVCLQHNRSSITFGQYSIF